MQTGSYTFDGFTESHHELERLLKQAKQVEPFERSVLQTAGLGDGMKALDVGCGPGIISCLMASMVGSNGEVLGVDTSEELLATARQVGQVSEAINVSFQKADVYALDLPENSMDFVYSRLVFQHLNKPQAALEQLLKVLKPGGILCLSDIDDDWLSIEPEPAEFKSLIKRSSATQALQGGDRFVGHKLGSYMQGSGFDSVNVNIMPLNSQMMGMQNFIDLGLSFRVFATQTDEEHAIAKNELQALRTLVDIPEAWGFLAIFIATGKKPNQAEGE